MNEGKIQQNLDILQNSLHKLDESSQTKLLKDITAAIAAFVRSIKKVSDATEGIFDTSGEIAESVQEGFEELVGISNGKKTFLRTPAKILTLLLNINVDTVDKTQNKSQNSSRNNVENMAANKVRVRRLSQNVIPQRIKNKNMLNRGIRNTPF